MNTSIIPRMVFVRKSTCLYIKDGLKNLLKNIKNSIIYIKEKKISNSEISKKTIKKYENIYTNKFFLLDGKQSRSSNFIAIIKTTGSFNINPKVKKILRILKIQSPNNIIIIKKSSSILGLLKKINNHVIWGEISTPNLLKLVLRKKKNYSLSRINRNISVFQINYDKTINTLLNTESHLNFNLNSPSLHFVRKNNNSSKTYVGYIGTLINKILIKMI